MYRVSAVLRLYDARRNGCNRRFKGQKVKCIGYGKIRALYSVYGSSLFQDVCLPLRFHAFQEPACRYVNLPFCSSRTVNHRGIQIALTVFLQSETICPVSYTKQIYRICTHSKRSYVSSVVHTSSGGSKHNASDHRPLSF